VSGLAGDSSIAVLASSPPWFVRRSKDSDVGFVDAAVLAVVERLNEPKLATLDHRRFGILRPRHVDALRLLPEVSGR